MGRGRNSGEVEQAVIRIIKTGLAFLATGVANPDILDDPKLDPTMWRREIGCWRLQSGLLRNREARVLFLSHPLVQEHNVWYYRNGSSCWTLVENVSEWGVDLEEYDPPEKTEDWELVEILVCNKSLNPNDKAELNVELLRFDSSNEARVVAYAFQENLDFTSEMYGTQMMIGIALTSMAGFMLKLSVCNYNKRNHAPFHEYIPWIVTHEPLSQVTEFAKTDDQA